MIDLYTALKLIGITDDDEIVYLKTSDIPSPVWGEKPSKILSLKEVKEKYDLRKTKVTKISPYFCCHDYTGLVITIAV